MRFRLRIAKTVSKTNAQHLLQPVPFKQFLYKQEIACDAIDVSFTVKVVKNVGPSFVDPLQKIGELMI